MLVVVEVLAVAVLETLRILLVVRRFWVKDTQEDMVITQTTTRVVAVEVRVRLAETPTQAGHHICNTLLDLVEMV
jgi:hypothetical protein